MKHHPFITMLCTLLLLTACTRSKEPQYYVLNPLLAPANQPPRAPDIRLGIDAVNIPDYLDKSQLTVYCTAHQSNLDEHHQWVESLGNNIKRVVRTNLSTLMPGALVIISPWDSKFRPNYQLQVNISQFKVDIQGRSILQAEYVIYKEEQPLRKYNAFFVEKLPQVTPASLVVSMNNNLTKLTRDIARHLIQDFGKPAPKKQDPK